MSRSSWLRRLALTAFLLPAGSGCETIFGPSDCTTELTAAYGPKEVTIRVGDTFTARATGLTCGGEKEVDTDISWTTSDPTVVVIGQKSGLAVGVGRSRLR